MKKYDIIILGTGIGLTPLEAAIQNKMTCALIEPSKFGGTCLTKGCIPSKILTTTADYIREAKEAENAGVSFSVDKVNIPLIIERMQSQIDNSIDIEKSVKNIESVDIFKGFGEFTGNKTIKVRYADGTYSEEITSDIIVICIGARPFIPSIDGLNETGFFSSESFFNKKDIDKDILRWNDIVLVGGGAIGLEFSHFFSAIGKKVTLLEMKDRILSTEEEEISQFVSDNLKDFGVEIITGSVLIKTYEKNGRKNLVIKNMKTDELSTIITDEIFIASGIRSNGDLAKISNTDIKTDERGWIITDEYLKTSVPGIWAIGDINGKFQLRHKANYEGEICVHNIFDENKEMKKASYKSVPWAVFTYPQIARVGITLEQALKKYDGVYVGTKRYSSIAKGFALGFEEGNLSDGFVKLIADKNFKILGAHIVGCQASVLIQPYVYLMNSGCSCIVSKKRVFQNKNEYDDCPDYGTVKPIGDSMVIHPALSELTAWVVSEMRWVE